jgi:radical SAM superfamily enzyme YgiQ (UPF0313 family)
MRIKLIYLPKLDLDYRTGKFNFKTLYIPPIGISVLTAYLKNHHIKVSQDDLFLKTHNRIDLIGSFGDENRIKKLLANKYNDPLLEEKGENILRLTKVEGYDIIGFSIYDPENVSSVGIALILAKIIKEKYDPIIIIGGHIPLEVEKTLLESNLIDCSIQHEFLSPAELNLLAFCEGYERGIKKENIPGIKYLKNKRLVINKSRYSKEKLKEIIRPCFDGLPLHLYKHVLIYERNSEYYKQKIFVLPYFFIKGCSFKCAFCVRSLDPFWITKKPEEVVEDLVYLSRKYKTKYFFFLNSAINPTYRYTEEIAKELIKNDVNIMFCDCANFINLDKKLLLKLKEAGCVRLIFGLESVSERLLRYIGKHLDLEQARTILKCAHEIGIWSEIDSICGFPYERPEDTNLFIKFIRENRKWIKSIILHKFFFRWKN